LTNAIRYAFAGVAPWIWPLWAPPSPSLDNIRVMVTVWRLRANIIRAEAAAHISS